MKIAILFDNFGPYHWSRIEAASRCSEVVAIEVARKSAEYAWKRRNIVDCDEALNSEGHQLKELRVDCLFEGTSQKTPTSAMAVSIQNTLTSACPDVVFVPGWSSRAALLSLLWCIDNKVPAVVMSETTPWDDARKPIKEWLKRRVVNCFSAALAGGTAHSEYLEQLRFPRDHICLGYDAVDNDYFTTQAAEIRAKADLIRREHGLPHHFFLASARFIEKKNLAGLLTAFAQYRKKHELEHRATATDSWHLVLLGDGELRTDLEQLRAQLGLDRTVHMPGFKQYEDLPTYYGTANAFVHASTTEQWGLVVNEAMASGLPVLVSNRCGCARDLVRDDVNGFTFAPYNVAELSELMYRVATLSDATRHKFGESSREMIAAWGPDRFARGVNQSSAIASSSSPRRPSSLTRILLTLAIRFHADTAKTSH